MDIDKDSKKKFKKLSNEKLIMKALQVLLEDINQLKAIVASSYPNMASTVALKEELRNRINKE